MSTSETTSPTSRRGSRVLRLAPLIVLIGLAGLVFTMGWHRELSLEGLVRHRAALEAFIAAHRLQALAIFVAIYIAAVALSLPGAVFLTVGAGVLFGWALGGVAAVLGATLGATALFLIARGALADYVRRRVGTRVNQIIEGFRADAFNYLLFLRLVPAFPFWLVNLAPALAGVSLGTFVTATAIGIIPGTFAFAIFGAGLDSVLAAQEGAYRACVAATAPDCRLDFNIRAALTPQLLAALCALGVVALIPVGVRRWRARHKPDTAPV